MIMFQRNIFTPLSDSGIQQAVLPFRFDNSKPSASAGNMSKTFIQYTCKGVKDNGGAVPTLVQLQSAWNEGLNIAQTVERLSPQTRPVPFGHDLDEGNYLDWLDALARERDDLYEAECEARGEFSLAPQGCRASEPAQNSLPAPRTLLMLPSPVMPVPTTDAQARENRITNALLLIREGMTITRAASVAGLPRETIRNRWVKAQKAK